LFPVLSDREIGEVDDTPQGNALVLKCVSQKVGATAGPVRVELDMPILAVTAFEAVEE